MCCGAHGVTVVSGCAACDVDLMIVMVGLQFSRDAPVVMMVLQMMVL